MERLCILALAIARMHGGFSDPESDAFRLRNPIMLKCFSPNHEKDEKTGCRIFKSFVSGFDAGVLDLQIKCTGASRSKLTPANTLYDLISCYKYPGSCPSSYVAKFLRHVPEMEDVTENTSLQFFLEK